jgi:hypothetical protein
LGQVEEEEGESEQERLPFGFRRSGKSGGITGGGFDGEGEASVKDVCRDPLVVGGIGGNGESLSEEHLPRPEPQQGLAVVRSSLRIEVLEDKEGAAVVIEPPPRPSAEKGNELFTVVLPGGEKGEQLEGPMALGKAVLTEARVEIGADPFIEDLGGDPGEWPGCPVVELKFFSD